MKIIHQFFFLMAVILTAACSQSPSPKPMPSKPLVLVSVAPYQLFVERIGGDFVEVKSIVPVGANAHSYEPTPRYMESLNRGQIWFRIGEAFEQPLLKIFKGQRVDLRDGIELMHVENLHCTHCSMDHQDRHIWMSPKLAKKQAAAIAEALSVQFPEHRQVFQSNLAALHLDLDALDEQIQARLAPLKERVLLVSHPAFGYFCRDYSLTQLSVEYEGKDPRPKHLEEILLLAQKHRPEVALALPQHNNKGAQVIAQELHLPVQMIDPYSPDYFKTMRQLAELIAAPKKS